MHEALNSSPLMSACRDVNSSVSATTEHTAEKYENPELIQKQAIKGKALAFGLLVRVVAKKVGIGMGLRK